MEVTGGSLDFKATIEYSQLVSAVKKIESRLSGIEDVANGAGNAIDGIGSKLAGLVSTAGIAAFAKKIFDVRSSFEDAEAAMNVFTKDVDVAKKHLAELQDYAWYNMFEFDQLVDASKQLQAFGTNVDDVIPVIDKLSNVAAATGGELGRFVQLYNKSKARGVLDSETLASFASQGFVVKNELKLMGEAVDGNTISFEQFSKALDHATSEGGMFAGLMNEQFNNLSSLWGAVQDSWTSMLNDIGKGTQGVMKDALKTLNDIISNWKDIADVLLYVVAAYGTYRAALVATTLIQQVERSGILTNIRLIGMYRKELGLAAAAQQAFGKAQYAKMMTNMYAALAAAVVLATVAIVKHIRKQNELGRELRKVDEEFEQQKDAINSDIVILGKLEKGTDEYNDKLKEITANYPHYIKYMKDENGALLDAAEARDRVNEAMEKELLLRKYQKAIEVTDKNVDERTEKISGRITKVLDRNDVKIDGDEANDVEMSWISDVIIEEFKQGFAEGTYEALGETEQQWDEFSGRFVEVSSNAGREANQNLFSAIKLTLEELGVSSENVDLMVANIVGKLTDKKLIASLKTVNMLNESAGAKESELREQEKAEQQAELERLRKEQESSRKSLSSIRKEYNEKKKERDNMIADIKKNGYTEDVTDEKGNVIAKGSKTQLEELNKELSNLDEKYESFSGTKLSKAIEDSKKKADEAARAIRALNEEKRKLAEHDEDIEFENRERTANLKDGLEKELELRKLNHDKTMKDIERWVEEEGKLYEEIDKRQWLADNPQKNEEDFYRQYSGLSKEVGEKIANQAQQQKDDENARYLKEQTDFLNDMLSKYGEYTESKRRIDEEYSQNLNYLNEQMANAATEQQKQQIQEAIGNLKTEWAQKQFDLDMEVFDSSYFDSVDSKMQALNGVYAAYISNLVKAGASQEMLNAVTREWNSLTGKSAQLNAKLEDLEQEKALAVERGDIDLVKALNGEMSKLRKEQDKMQKDGEKKDFKTSLLDWWDENKKDLIVKGLNEIGSVMTRFGKAAGNTGLKDLGEAVSGISSIVDGYMQGGWVGAATTAVKMVYDEVLNIIEANLRLEQAIEKANVDSWVDRMEASMDTDGIFGEDSVANVNASLKVIEEAKKKLDEVWNGGKVNAQDRSGFANFFGIKDDYRELGDMARELGRDLYDSYGNLDSDTLQAILDTYEDLGAEDRKWMEEAIAYSDEYAEAMENVASYLEDLFGAVAGDIADKMVDAFIETGNAAVDLGEVVSDVGKQMAKDLIKSMILEKYFGGLEEDFNKRIAENGMNAETSSYIIAKINEAVQAIDGDMQYWNNVLTSLSSMWGDASEEASSTLGTSLSAASQESIDMMTGQLNAIRTHQITIESRVDSVLLSLAGIRQDMNSNARNAEGYLDKIEINTRSTNNSLIRGFGL